MATTPYELRQQLLQMARELLVEEFYMKRDTILEQWRAKCSDAERCGANNPDMPKIPDFPTHEEIIERASKLNQFISSRTAP